MTGAAIGWRRRRGGFALALIVFALLMRVLVPAGWMPASERGLMITLCTGTGAQQAWMDERGTLHEGKPGEGQADHPCVFAGFAALLDLPSSAGVLDAPRLTAPVLPALVATAVAIGHGLAAPPPPSTGPPARL